MLDLIFLSYAESNSELNWQKLTDRFPRAQRLHGIDGVAQAHATAARMSRTDYFFIIDGDNEILPEFEMDFHFTPNPTAVYVWRAKNPVNDLTYGYGGIKLYNKSLFEKLNASLAATTVDLATTISLNYHPIPEVASITHFNATPLEAWRGGFREAVKLTMNILKNPADHVSAQRLETWCSKGSDRLNGSWAIRGAQQGHAFAQKEWNEDPQAPSSLSIINNFQFLNSLFENQNSRAPEMDL